MTRLAGSVLRLAGAHIVVEPAAVISTYPDGAQSAFYPPTDDPEFCKCAQMFGYTDPLQYGLEHDVTHHLIAELLLWPHSKVIWSAAHNNDWSLYSKEERWAEEHLCNRMLRFINTGDLDEDFGVLRRTFGDSLGEVAGCILATLRPWLDCRLSHQPFRVPAKQPMLPEGVAS